MRITPIEDQSNIVLVGNFNPAIFHPFWLVANKLLGPQEAENAALNIVHTDISQFSIQQFALDVRLDRFTITSLDTHPEHILDFMITCFGTLLPHVPIRMMGINRSVIFDTGGPDIRDRVGHELAPREAWGVWGKEILEATKKSHPHRSGMTSITMRQSPRPDGQEGYIDANITPSQVVNKAAIRVAVNDHYQLATNDSSSIPASQAVEVLKDVWEKSLERSAIIADQIMALTEKCKT